MEKLKNEMKVGLVEAKEAKLKAMVRIDLASGKVKLARSQSTKEQAKCKAS